MSVRTLFEHGLDELRAMLYPVVLGSGTRVFGETSDPSAGRGDDAPRLRRGVSG